VSQDKVVRGIRRPVEIIKWGRGYRDEGGGREIGRMRGSKKRK